MTELQITKRLYWHLVWKAWYLITTHQFDNHFWIADMWGINKSKFAHEFEIKCTKSDLMSEINDIKAIHKWEKKWGAKFHKHFKYLTGVHHSSLQYTSVKHDHQDWLVPTYFSFVVPVDLVELAILELEWTPYGVIQAKEYGSGSIYFSTMKKVKAIHRRKVSEWIIFKMAHRMSFICEKFINQ